jgi:hypothetical protein
MAQDKRMDKRIVVVRNVETLIDATDKAYQAWCAEPWHQ